jgi:hypothetical protein
MFIITSSPFHIRKDSLSNKTQICKSNYLFMCSIFNDAVSNSGYIAFNEWLLVNDEMEWMWKEAIVAYFMIQFQHLAGDTEGKSRKSSVFRPRFEMGTSGM